MSAEPAQLREDPKPIDGAVREPATSDRGAMAGIRLQSAPGHERHLDLVEPDALEEREPRAGRRVARVRALTAEALEWETLDEDQLRRTLDRVRVEAPSAPPLRLVPPQTHLPHRSVAALSAWQRVRYWVLALIWLAATTGFWGWWLGVRGHATPWLYWLQSTMLFYQTTLLPTIYWCFVRKMRKPIEVPAPPGMKVALIATCVPAHESLAVIRQQLNALAGVSYPHDSWILDEGGVPEVRALAEERGVNYFTRRGVGMWNQDHPPFQRATKAGNVNAWLDHVASLGLDYDVFVQFDIDHRPRPDYLDRTLGYFNDSRIAWVQGPSVYGNLDNWAARGLTEQDLVFHGPLQMGFYGSNGTPFIIGSHTAYRMTAIREIGGFQPTRAEDHLDTVVLAANDYRGVYVPEILVVGTGPDDLATYLRQQFAWAYSMMQITLQHMPRLIRRHTPGQALQFVFCQSWYSLWSVSLAVLWMLPVVALFVHEPIAHVRVSQFALYFAPVELASSIMWCATRRWFRPVVVRLSWRGVLLCIARWPVVLWAVMNALFGIRRSYMVTPKGIPSARPRASILYGPGVALTLLPLAAVWEFHLTAGASGVGGYYGLALLNALVGTILVTTLVALEIRQHATESGTPSALRKRAGMICVVCALIGLLAFSTLSVWDTMVRLIG